MRVGRQRFALALEQVRDVRHASATTPVPLAPAPIAGLFAWRQRMVTVLDLRTSLALEANPEPGSLKDIIVDYEGEWFALRVDALEEVESIVSEQWETLSSTNGGEPWRSIGSAHCMQGGTRLARIDLVKLIGPLVGI